MSESTLCVEGLCIERRKLRENRIIFLSGDIEQGISECVIEDFLILLAEDSKEPITLIIFSEGGEVGAGYAIIRVIEGAQRKGIKVIGSVYGRAMSMAFLILQCCDERKMGKYCKLMCHGVTSIAIGDIKNVEAEQKLMKMFQQEMAELLAKRCTSINDDHKEPGYWYAILEDNTPQFYNYKDALEEGLIDIVEGI